MEAVVRIAKKEDAAALHRFLEQSYGHGRDFFYRHYPDRYRDEDDALSCFHIVVEDGQIVSNVGVFPMEVVILGEHFKCAGIGGVATHPQARGKGYMTRLLEESLRGMREEGSDFSVLWGNRQRYGSFGYELCGGQYHLVYSKRSFERGNVKPEAVMEVEPADPEVIERIRCLHQTLSCRVERPCLPSQLKRLGLRIFVGSSGYLISNREFSGDLYVEEVISPEGEEAGLIYGALNCTFGSRAHLCVEAAHSPRNRRLFGACESWSISPQAMFRIVNWSSFMLKLRPVLEQLAVDLPPFGMSIGCKDGETLDVVSVEWNGKKMTVVPKKGSGSYVELDVRELTSLVFGGPPASKDLGTFGLLLPVPVFIAQMDAI